MDFEESLPVLAGGGSRKRRRLSTSSVPSLAKKSKVDETEGQRPASAPPTSLGYETDSQIDKGVMYREEDKDQVMQHVDDPMPHQDKDMDVEPEDIQSFSRDGTYSKDGTDVEFISDSEDKTY